MTGEVGVQRGIHQHLDPHQGIQGDVEQQSGEHGGHRRRTLGVRIRQPVVQRHQTHLGAIADQQEDEGERDYGRIEAARRAVQHGPQQRVIAVPAEFALGGKIDEHGSEQGLAMPTRRG